MPDDGAGCLSVIADDLWLFLRPLSVIHYGIYYCKISYGALQELLNNLRDSCETTRGLGGRQRSDQPTAAAPARSRTPTPAPGPPPTPLAILIFPLASEHRSTVLQPSSEIFPRNYYNGEKRTMKDLHSSPENRCETECLHEKSDPDLYGHLGGESPPFLTTDEFIKIIRIDNLPESIKISVIAFISARSGGYLLDLKGRPRSFIPAAAEQRADLKSLYRVSNESPRISANYTSTSGAFIRKRRPAASGGFPIAAAYTNDAVVTILLDPVRRATVPPCATCHEIYESRSI
ncbi:hypothetical protein EVAR_14262_1 [Eumeta japonica]|uniref:Uncharacterized protein n=1 Tax=Eumeta variegata TaxID=151549 RepID=A0A4C1WA40_EUMVA|nr:hypothetical protein EVAR_14262_1 [Eumeta japonica]